MSEKAIFEFGGPCPPLKAWFFPNDPNQEPREIEPEKKEEGEKDDATQPT